MRSLLETYQEFLPSPLTAGFEGLGEGFTPLVKSRSIGDGRSLYLKMEHLNPTGSFKDRFGAVVTAQMKGAGIRTFIATSSGNTGAALSAYAARHELNCLLFVNEIVPESKLRQMLVYGAKVFQVKDFGVTRDLSAPIFERLRKLATAEGVPLVISAYEYSSDGMEGVKTIAYEIADDFDDAPEHVFVPVGGGGLLTAIWRGFDDLMRRKLISQMPRIHAVQPELNDTLVTPLAEGRDNAREVGTTTSISGLAVQVDIDASRALRSVKHSNGQGFLVTDDEIRQARAMLSEKEGVYAEPAGAASVAGYLKANAAGAIGPDDRVVCILTGHGLKDASDGAGGSPAARNITADQITRDLLVQN